MNDNKEHLLDAIKREARWNKEDYYPAWEEWRSEDSKLLEFAKQKGVLDTYSNRLKTDNKCRRDETINELRTAYFLEKGCDASIVEWHPNNGRGDFFISMGGRRIFCEVKSPGWEREAVDAHGRNSPRLQQPKYIPSEVKGVDNSPYIKDSIKKAYEKFPDNIPTLLILIDDFWMNCFNEALCIDRALYRKRLPPPCVDNISGGLFISRDYELLGGVLFINFSLTVDRGFVWKIYIAQNENAKIRLPNALLGAIKSIKDLDGSIVENYKINNGWLEKS